MNAQVGQPHALGKTKTLYPTEHSDILKMVFEDAVTAFNDANKTQHIPGKGVACRRISSFLMRFLAEAGFATHWVANLDDRSDQVVALTMIPLEVVVRYQAAGSLSKRLGVAAGRSLDPPIVELYYKNDLLGDPWITPSHAVALGWTSEVDVCASSTTAVAIAHSLRSLFAAKGVLLVDLKLEFGRDPRGQLVLGDEISPDNCRLWDATTHTILDKDRFRQGLGGVLEAYQEVARRLGA